MQGLLELGESIRLSLLCHLVFLCLKMETKKITGKETPSENHIVGDTCHHDIECCTGSSVSQGIEVSIEWPANQVVCITVPALPLINLLTT